MLQGYWAKMYAAARLTARGLRLRPWGSLLTLLACWFASCQLAFLLLVVDIADRASTHPATSGSMVAYLGQDTPGARIAEIEATLRARPDVSNVTFVPREKGLEKMRSWLGADNPVVQEVDPRILPDAFEITLDRRYADRAALTARDIASLPGVADVRYRRGLIGLIASSFRRIAVAAAVAGGIAALGLALVIFLSVRVSLLSRANEISVMKTLGASALFLFGPYALEGMLYGFLGSTTGLVTVTLSIRPFLEQNPVLSPLVRPQIVRHACVLIPFGTLCGLLGALAAAARGRNA